MLSDTCSKPFSFADFFKDSPWLSIPIERQAVFIAPLYPRGGLLGGSPDAVPKVSKLQALAAARKKKAQEQKSAEVSSVEKPMAGLSLSENGEASSDKPASKTSRGFPMRKRKDSNPHEKAPKAPPPEQKIEEPDTDTRMDIEPLQPAEPSAFANTMFSSTSRQSADPVNLFSLPYASNAAPTITDPFAGPSPDDVVIAAQSKGSTNPARPKK